MAFNINDGGEVTLQNARGTVTAIQGDNTIGVTTAIVQGGSAPNLQDKSVSYTPSTSTQGGTVTADEGYDGLGSVSVSVSAMPTGTAGTPTATKGTVSNHAVSVTPSVTNTAGYITGGTKTGTAVSVSASDLVSGDLSITSSGTKDVTNYASATVASGGATASATKGAVSNHSVSVTPSVTRTAGYVTAGTASGTAVTVSASELVSGSETKTANGTYDVTNLAEVVVNVSGGASNIVQGTFTSSATRTGTTTVSVPYTGSGYPIAAMVFIAGGAYNNSTGGNTTWYNSVDRYDVGVWYMSKARQNTVPGYTTSGADNYGVTAWIFKNNATTATTYSRSSAMTSNTYTSSSTNATSGGTCVRFKGDGKTLTVYTGNKSTSAYGFPPSTELQYIIIYSS